MADPKPEFSARVTAAIEAAAQEASRARRAEILADNVVGDEAGPAALVNNRFEVTKVLKRKDGNPVNEWSADAASLAQFNQSIAKAAAESHADEKNRLAQTIAKSLQGEKAKALTPAQQEAKLLDWLDQQRSQHQQLREAMEHNTLTLLAHRQADVESREAKNRQIDDRTNTVTLIKKHEIFLTPADKKDPQYDYRRWAVKGQVEDHLKEPGDEGVIPALKAEPNSVKVAAGVKKAQERFPSTGSAPAIMPRADEFLPPVPRGPQPPARGMKP